CRSWLRGWGSEGVMVRLLVLLSLIGSPAWAVFDACTAYNPSDGIVCTTIDGVTQGVCIQNTCIRNYTIPGNAARTGTGTISSSSTTVTGTGTQFSLEQHVGDLIAASGQTVLVTAIASNTSLTTDPGFTPVISAGTAFTWTNPIVRMLDASGNAVGQWDVRGTLIPGPSQKILVGPDTITGSTAVGALTLQGQAAGGGQIKLDDIVQVLPGLTQFSGSIGTPTTAIDFVNTLSAQSSGKEFSYFN